MIWNIITARNLEKSDRLTSGYLPNCYKKITWLINLATF
ncbi:hypothetical protein D1BOALGB6SA_10205 [Olavius sp. associated proteobacterium Delta 1]|nr:hypothetical protein D1BOALGB6SA_10205 [Olavius sp. associated proteobacterium Delta 1]